mmetsp:Transcript_24231/g.49990  ORF Transcript_24231/g.49990 Transcript_24231/m.49990 type:complete len:80 (-) Transcript_24231:41-280(-)
MRGYVCRRTTSLTSRAAFAPSIFLPLCQRPEDIEEIHALIDEKLPTGAFKPHVMAKIEKPSCFEGDSLKKIIECKWSGV